MTPVINRYENVSIVGMASAVSNKWQSIEECVETYGVEDGFNIEKFKKNTGVTGRWIAGDYQTTSDFCYVAAEALISKYRINRDDVGVLIFVTQSPDYEVPATACVLHKRLQLSKNCIAFDVNQGCSGYVYGINIASALLETGNFKYALMLCGDTSAKNPYRNRVEYRASHSSLFLFGDSGTASLLCKGDAEEPIVVMSCTEGEGYKAIMSPGRQWRHPFLPYFTIMDDIAVFNFATSEVPDMINEYIKILKRTPDYYDGLVLHQASQMIMRRIAKKTGFSTEKLLSSLDTFANTSSASIPNTLVKVYGKDSSKDLKHFIMCGFGVGLSWAVMKVDISPANILPLLNTDEHFDDGYPEESQMSILF